MANHIRDIRVVNYRLDPHETELRMIVTIDELTSTMEINGRLVGPRCEGRTTVEVAHPMRLVGRTADAIEMRVVIPEPCWWSPDAPFVYEGRIELWRDGVLCERREISHGIRKS